MVGSVFTLTITEPVDIVKISVGLSDNFGNAAINLLGAIYSGNNLLGMSGSTRKEPGNFHAAQFFDIPFNAPVRINSSGDYTIVVASTQTAENIRYDAGAADQGKAMAIGTFSPTMSFPPVASWTLTTNQCSVYATYVVPPLAKPGNIKKSTSCATNGISVSPR